MGRQDTNWPKEASNDVRAFAETMETQLALDKVPNEEEEVPEQVKLALERLLEHLENAKTKLKKESQKYDPKKKGFRQELKKLVSKNNPNECAEVVRNCRDDVVRSSTALRDILNNLYPENEQPSSRAAGGSAGDDAGGPVEDHGAQTASTPNLTMNVKSDPATTSVPSNKSPDQSVPQVGQLTSSKAGKQKATLRREGWLNSVNKAFKIAEGASGALPVVGTYVEAVARIGLTVVEMVEVSASVTCRSILVYSPATFKTMDDNEETAERLGDHVCRLSDVLERVRKYPQESGRTQATNAMNELQRYVAPLGPPSNSASLLTSTFRELRSVQDQIEGLRSQRKMEKVWSSGINAGKLKTLQEQVRVALEELQVNNGLLKGTTSDLR
ncbi:hypothetical protein FRC01_009443 [Tulasnella sp. 417]|nr:hypothetical protein FRC01_009443 [Tulasnella sp. 417]